MERERDPDKFKVEYGAQFTTNLSALVASDVVDACVDDKRLSLPPAQIFKAPMSWPWTQPEAGSDETTTRPASSTLKVKR